MGRMRTVRQASASFECCRDSCFGLIGRHADVDVGPATPRLGRAEALERHVRVPSVPIDDVFFRSKAPVPEGCGPERTYVAAGILCHRNAHDLDLGGVRLDPQLPSFCRNLACQLDITRLRAPYSPEAVRTVTPSGRTSTSGKWPTTSATSAIAATNPAASANDPTGK
jgi:hypothetical protein